MHRDPLGEAGDFITAPEVSQMFGELIGLWCVVLWRQMGEPASIILAELGPGRGTLMADALRAARREPDFAAAVRVHLVETSPFLRRRQQTVLTASHPGMGVQWHERLQNVPRAGPLLLIANEFFDALPIRQYVRTDGGWRERRIGLKHDRREFVFVLENIAEPLLPPSLADIETGMVVETGAERTKLAQAIGHRIAHDGGAALVIDYGHIHSAPGDTLQAVRRHAFQGVLDRPGEADLTAHVDFAALLAAARSSGVRTYGPLPQGMLLARLGIEARARTLIAQAQPDQAAGIASSLRRLVHPVEMGLMFKAVALTNKNLPPPPGFDA